MEATVDEKVFSLMLGHDSLERGTHAAVTTSPVNQHELAALLQHTLQLFEETEAVLDLKERVCEQNGIQGRFAQVRAGSLLDFPPDL